MVQLPKKDEAGEGQGEVNEVLFPGGAGACSLSSHLEMENENLDSQGGCED